MQAGTPFISALPLDLTKFRKQNGFPGGFLRKLIGLIAFVMILSVPAAAQTQPPVRVNCGGPSYIDSKGQVWDADHGFNSGSRFPRP